MTNGSLRPAAAALWAAALLSGAATLIYELAWIRELILWIGATYPAISVVMASFMLGLGAGSIAGGAVADRVRRPALAYAAVEVGVAGCAVAFPWVAEAVGSADVEAAWGPVSSRAILAGLALLPGTTLMGATFPLLSKALHADDGARHVPWLYAANTAGAAVGCALGGLVLPFALGVRGAEAVALAANLAAAALAVTASREVRAAPQAEGSSPPGALLALAFGSGVLVLAAELFWTRSILQLNHTAYDVLLEPTDLITVVITLVLLGSAAGGLVCTRLGEWTRERAARGLSALYAGIAVSSLALLEYPAVFLFDLGRPFEQWPWYVLPARVAPIVVPSALLGVSFPLLARLYAGAWPDHGRRMGLVWMVNSVGATLGSLLGGWWLLGRVGSGPGLVLCSALALGLAILAASLGPAAQRRRLAAPIALAAAAVALVGGFVPLVPGQSHHASADREVRAAWESWEATTLVVAQRDGPRERLMLETNGRMVGMTHPDRMIEHVEQAAADARSALVVGFGTGGMAASLLQLPSLERLVIVEIDGSQLQAAPWFAADAVLRDPRVTFVTDDALHHLAVTEETYDLVVVDGWGPRVAPALYTAEFHERAQRRLTERGVVVAKMIRLADDSERKVLDGFRCTYPHTYQASRPMMLIGSMQALSGLGAVPRAAGCDPLRHLFPFRLYEERLPQGGGRGGKGRPPR